MAEWYPNADRSATASGSGSFVAGYAKKGVIHTTEGGSAAGAIGAYRSANAWPHFTVAQDGKVYQHISINVAARALQNLSGGVETNRGGAIQIEVVGYASKTTWPAAQVNAMKNLMRWIEAQTGIKQYGPTFGGSNQYGRGNPLEFSGSYWTSFNGWCGHQHVPENSHWDPGAINLNNLWSNAVPPPPPTPTPPPPVSFIVPASYSTEEIIVPFTVKRPQGGYMIVGGDGGVFTYDGAPFKGSLGGLALNKPIVAGAYSPSGEGYWLIDQEGAIFSFGDAPFKGGLNGTPHLGPRKIIGLVAKGNGYRIVTLDPTNDGSPFDVYDLGV
jgi:hypothetical protein